MLSSQKCNVTNHGFAHMQLLFAALYVLQNMQNIVVIKNSRIPWPTKILMPFLSFSENLLQYAYIIF